MRIAWALTDYPEGLEPTCSEIWVGDIDMGGDSPRLINKRKVVDRNDVSPQATFEPQNFRPPHEDELVFTAYAYRGGEVMGVDLDSGEVRNYSQNVGYEEAEGISPDGRYMLFQQRIVGGKHGNSDGLFLYDLKESPHMPRDFLPEN